MTRPPIPPQQPWQSPPQPPPHPGWQPPPQPPSQPGWQSGPQPPSQPGWKPSPQPPAPSIWQRGWKPPSQPSSPPIPRAPDDFARIPTAILGGFFDQVAWLGMFPFFLGIAFWLGVENAVIGPIVGIVAAVATLIANSILALRRGFSVGMFIVGIRFPRGEPIDYFDDVLTMFLDFWIDLVRLPVWWLFAKIMREPFHSDAVYDEHARSARRRLARVLLAVLDLLLLLPLPLWILT